MTGNPGSRSDSASQTLDDDVVAALKKRTIRHAQILDGALPTYAELLAGLPLRHDDMQSDAMAAIDGWTSKRAGELPAIHAAAAEAARLTANFDTLHSLSDMLDSSRHNNQSDRDLWQRCQVWLAYHGDDDSIARVVSAAMSAYRWTGAGVDGVYRVSWAAGLKVSRTHEYEAGSADKVLQRGLANLDRVAELVAPISAACNSPTGLSGLISKRRPSHTSAEENLGTLDAFFGDVKEDDNDATGLVVVPVMPVGVGGQKDVRKSWQGLAGRSLPTVCRSDVALHRKALAARYPHAVDVIEVILSDLAPREEVRFRPTLLVGAPGSGKTSLLRAIADQVGLPCELNSLAGSTDSSAMGTSAQWSTVRESVPLQLIKRSGMASVAVIWDEIEKASESRNNGSVLNALLPMFEIDQAAMYRDLALEVEVNLSAVSHFATANSIDGVPQPLRDRFRILKMPEPTWQHIGVLSRQIVDRIAKERGIDPRFFGSMAEDELDLVRQAWAGGSIRQLTRIVTTIVDGRDRILGRC